MLLITVTDWHTSVLNLYVYNSQTLYAIFDLACHILVVVAGGDLSNEEQHITVYIFFILNGIIDMNRHIKWFKMPNGTDYIASSITWTALGFLFLSHKHAKTTVSIYYHQTFGWMAIAVGFVTLIQYKFAKNTLTALVRGSCCILTGTWLYQVYCHDIFVLKIVTQLRTKEIKY